MYVHLLEKKYNYFLANSIDTNKIFQMIVHVGANS